MQKLTSDQTVHLLDKGGAKQHPPVWLNPFTKVELQQEIDPVELGQFEVGHYYKVRVLEGAFLGKEGYLTEASFSSVPSRNIQGVGFSTDMVPNTSGVRYGMDTKHPTEDRYVLWKQYCRHCGESPALHILPETNTKNNVNGTREDWVKLRAAVVADKTKQISPAMMLGVLHVVGGEIYASHSGKQDNAHFKGLVERMGWRYAEPTIQNDIINRRGEKATDGTPNSDLQGYDYQCAAPRLIQRALHDNKYPVAMTEGYAVGPKGDKENPGIKPTDHTIRSCRRCVITVPYMLCPE